MTSDPTELLSAPGTLQILKWGQGSLASSIWGTRYGFIQKATPGLCFERYAMLPRWTKDAKMWKSRDHSGNSRWSDETKGRGCLGWGAWSGNHHEGPLRHEKELRLLSRDSDEPLRGFPPPCWYFSSFQCWTLLHGGMTWSELPSQKIPLPKFAFPVSFAQLWPYSGILPKVSTVLFLKIVSLSLGAHNFTAQYFRRNYTWFHSLGLVLLPDCTSSAFCVHSFVSQITSHGRSHLVPGGDEGHLMDVELKFCSSQHLPCLGGNPISSTVKWHNNSFYLIRLFWEFNYLISYVKHLEESLKHDECHVKCLVLVLTNAVSVSRPDPINWVSVEEKLVYTLCVYVCVFL